MTPAQSAELEQLNTDIKAEPTNGLPRMRRALLLARVDADFVAICDDCEVFVRGSVTSNTARLVNMGRQYWRTVRQKNSADPEVFQRAMAAAHLTVALESQPDAGRWFGRATVVALCQMNDGEAMRQLIEGATDEDETPQGWRTMALVCAVVDKFGVAAERAKRALQLEIADGLWPAWQQSVSERITDRDLPSHEQLAWLDLQVESAPTSVNYLLERADWLAREDRFARALADYDGAVQLRPRDAELWEKRGIYRLSRDFDEANPIESAFADFARALRLRLGSPAETKVETLQQQGDKWMNVGPPKMERADAFRAYACYSLAIEKAPSARLYLVRAHTMFQQGISGPSRSPAENERAYADYARALALDETQDEARAGIVFYLEFLKHDGGRLTAHQQIESFIEARQQLRDFGVAPAVIIDIIAQVERALAA